ncbi:phage shock protein A (PspA) family protein [Litoreibacter ponti]|uniref:Phage shock protein A (PspA) family protein n=1 Tax=Litoreibacter ponti TaxID=1510457 RepID=A0A2T6BFE4_9RHOB|nr:PspA/IM30 family protein [Litoreibacter ponti]PTX54780.1 phage shock protein A (PspA) family protein [Litoreibacter ponti]
MFMTLKTLMTGANARAEERVRDVYAIELIEQKIREAQNSLTAAKATLASLIQRQRGEQRQVTAIEARVSDLTDRATKALDDGNEGIASEAANAIAQLENELEVRRATLDRLDQRILRLRQSIETGHRRIIDLKQGAITAKAVRYEQNVQAKLNTTLSGQSSVAEAEELIANVLGKDDPFEQAEILADIDRDLSHETLADRMSDAGYGDATRSTGADVLARLKSKK